jgi:DNA helicase-2/ATP-dependent DNA helicase PcrA
MTLHTAKGLEFPVVFLTGMEDGTFPHIRSMYDSDELAEERRLAYVGLTRARQRLYLTRSAVRSAWGTTNSLPESRFVADIPEHLIDWQRRHSATESIRNSGLGSNETSSSSLFGGGHWGTMTKRNTHNVSSTKLTRSTGGTGSARKTGTGSKAVASSAAAAPQIPDLAVGDRVTHDEYGLGRVVDLEGMGRNAVAKVEFRAAGTKRLVLRYAPLQKL